MPNANKMVCPDCGVEMNHHANKVEYGEAEAAEDVFGGALVEAHACPECGRTDTRPAAVE
jgi:ribosomal protein S27AE